MRESFGARLRQRREEREITLVTIAQQTKIKLSLLDALERDDVSLWPAGIFRRAFVRAYAHAIGLDPDVVVREFLAIHPDPAEVVQTGFSSDARATSGRTTGGPPTRLREMVVSAIGSLSRLRRSPTSDDGLPAGANPVTVDVPADPDLAAAGLPLSGRPPASDPDFLAVANLCTEFCRIESADEVPPLLQEAAGLLDAVGLIVWLWDQPAGQLRPALVHGYSDKVLAQLPAVGRDADNVTAAAFRSAQTCAINGSDHTSGALVVPLLTPSGCAGVLAIELLNGTEQSRSVRAAATIFAALLAPLVGGHAPKEVDLRQAAG